MVTPETLMALAALLFIKHLAADGPLQTSYQVRHKGDFLHPGGLLHSSIHAFLTILCLFAWVWMYAVPLAIDPILLAVAVATFEFVVHYTTDLTKVKIDRHFRWSRAEVEENGQVSLRITSNLFFIAFLADQTVHSLTYLAIVMAVGGYAIA